MRNFRKTLRTIILFVLLAAVFSGALTAVYFRGENYYYQDRKERDELAGSLDFVVSGASHSLCAFVPEVLDEDLDVNSYNLSIASGTMRERYELLAMELDRNPVDTVVIGLSYDSLTRPDEKRGWEGAFYLMAKMSPAERVSYLFRALSPTDDAAVYAEWLSRGWDCLVMALRGTWTSTNRLADKGHYLINEELANADWIPADYAAVYNTGSNWADQNESEVEYLNQMLDLCEEAGVEVVLVTVPISEAFICRKPDYDLFLGWYEEIAEERGLTFLDFNLYQEHWDMFSDEADFMDELHLNAEGSAKFTELFTSVYTMIQNGEDVSDLFYDSYEELESHADYYPE